MSEKRRPDLTVTVKSGDLTRRYEMFCAEQFSERAGRSSFYHAEQPNLMLTPLDFEQGKYVRVRCDGVWLPKGRRAMFPAGRASFLIAQDIHQQVLAKTEPLE